MDNTLARSCCGLNDSGHQGDEHVEGAFNLVPDVSENRNGGAFDRAAIWDSVAERWRKRHVALHLHIWAGLIGGNTNEACAVFQRATIDDSKPDLNVASVFGTGPNGDRWFTVTVRCSGSE